jgi:osmoprotectant transport system ATP-binding protein
MTTAIRLDGVTKRFPGSDVPAVDRLDLDLPAEAITVLVGPSGCGKTTVLRMVNRLIEPSAGRVLIDGADVRDTPAHELRRRIGHVIQSGGLFPHRSVASNIGTVPRLLGWSRGAVDDRVRELADVVGLDPALLDRYPAALSGGQRQRVGVARALAADPPILLMDEPYSAVDPVVRARLQDELLALQDRLGRTIVVVTHDIDEAVRLGDRMAVVNVGARVEQFASPDEILANPATPFVADFVGRDRNLRRAALRTVADVLDGRRRPTRTGGGGDTPPAGPDTGGSGDDGHDDGTGGSLPVVDPSTTLRAALDAALGSPTGAIAVVDRRSGTREVLDVDDLARALR